MTKEEYEDLLNSDYWRGYSYSLIKERNFTCQDCGRQFPNQRNKLHVHHLVYRDTNPWSYDPEELVVLCEDCHKRRHGIVSNDIPETNSEEEFVDRYEWLEEEQSRPYRRYILWGILSVLCISTFLYFLTGYKTENANDSSRKTDPSYYYDLSEESPKYQYSTKKKDTKKTAPSAEGQLLPDDEITKDADDFVEIPVSGEKVVETEKNLSTIELLEKKQHQRVVKEAKEAGVSTEGSTIDILERMQHARVVKEAKEAGVSTEGSTIDILERMQRKRLEKE